MNPTASIIEPLSSEQQQQVIDETNAWITRAEKLFDIKVKPVDIQFNLKGRCSGMYRIKQKKKLFFSHCQREIRYNPYIFSKYFEDNFTTTIPHEVAHYLTDLLHGLKNIKPHGSEWKAVMFAFGADASVTADYDLSGIPVKNQSRFSYQCDCREHQLSAIRHNKIKKRHYKYYCNACKQALRLKNTSDTETC